MMWNFVLFQFKKMRENKPTKSRAAPTTRKSNQYYLHLLLIYTVIIKNIIHIARSATKGEVSESDAVESDLDSSKLKTN